MSKYLIDVGVDDLSLTLFIGEEGKILFLDKIEVLKASGHDINVEEGALEYAQGLFIPGALWVKDWNRKILLHEMQHFFDDLFEELSITQEDEAKAIFMSNILDKVLSLRDKFLEESK